MSITQKQRDAGPSSFLSSINGLANVLAVIAVFLGTPTAYGNTIFWVQTYTAQHYGNGFTDLIAVAWFGICAATIFFIARASLSTALTFGGLAIATRFL